MELAASMRKGSSFISAAAESLRRMGGALGNIFTFSLADEHLATGQCLAVHLQSGGIAVAYGTRFLSRVRIKGTRHYGFEEGNYPLPEVVASTVHLAMNELRAQSADVTLIVPKAWTIVKTADFPLVVKENLSGVVGYELDRLTPLSPDKAYYDYQVIREEGDRLQIVLAALRAETLAPYLQALLQKGIQVRRVIMSLSALGTLIRAAQGEKSSVFLDIHSGRYEGGLLDRGRLTASFAGSLPDRGPERSRLLAAEINPFIAALKKEGKSPTVFVTDRAGPSPELAESILAPVRYPGEQDWQLSFRAGGKIIPHAALGGVLEDLKPGFQGLDLLANGVHTTARTPLALTILLACALVALGLFAMAASLQTEQKRVEAVDRAIAARVGEVKQIEVLQKERSALEQEINAIARFKTGRPMAMEILKELTRILPKDVWLARVRITDSTVDIEGYAASVTDILPKLEASRYLTKVEFASPTYRDVRMKADRFAIKMELEGLPQEKGKQEKGKNKKNSTFLMLAIPLAIVLAGLTVYEYGYLRVRTEVAAREETAFEKKKILKKYLTLIAERPRLAADLAALTEARKAEIAKTIEGQTPSIAAAAMQNTVKGLILARGGTISSERIEKPEDLKKFKIITVSVDAVLPDIRALSDTLFTIETQTPYLVVRELDASVRNFQVPRELTIRLKLSGLTGGR